MTDPRESLLQLPYGHFVVEAKVVSAVYKIGRCAGQS